MAPLPPLQQLGFGTSRWRLQGNATSGLRAGGRGHLSPLQDERAHLREGERPHRLPIEIDEAQAAAPRHQAAGSGS